MFNQIIRNTARMLVLRAGPQDLPASPLLIKVALALYIGFNGISFLAPGVSFWVGMMETLAATAVLAGFTYALLRMRAWTERFGQTLTALLLTGAIFTLLAIGPMLKLMPYIISGERPPLLLLFGPMAIIIWRIAVMAHIFRHALEISMIRAVAVVVGLDLVRWLMLVLLAQLGVFGGAF